jgi:hypothetical protein
MNQLDMATQQKAEKPCPEHDAAYLNHLRVGGQDIHQKSTEADYDLNNQHVVPFFV